MVFVGISFFTLRLLYSGRRLCQEKEDDFSTQVLISNKSFFLQVNKENFLFDSF